MGLIDFRPYVRLKIDGTPVSDLAFSSLSYLSITDTSGFIADTADVTFSNMSPVSRFAMPEPGAEFDVALGYLGKFKRMGIYIADEIEENSPPRTITAVCRAKAQAETQGGYAPIHQHKTRSWPAGLTLGAIAKTIASENGLKSGITAAAASIMPGHIDQIDESDLSVLTRVAILHDLVAKPAGGVLFIGQRAAGTNASGGSIPTISLWETQVTRWSMSRSLGGVTGSVIATYRDLSTAQDIEVTVGSGTPVRRLRQRFRSEREARTVATTEARRAGRTKEMLTLDLPGNPNIVADGKVNFFGASSAVTGEWLVETATHEVSLDGYKTMITAQRPE